MFQIGTVCSFLHNPQLFVQFESNGAEMRRRLRHRY